MIESETWKEQVICQRSHTKWNMDLFLFFLIFIVIQLQLYAFSPYPTTPPQLNPPPFPTSTLPLDFVHVSFIVVEHGFEPIFNHFKFYALKPQVMWPMNKITIPSINITARFYFYCHYDMLTFYEYINYELRTIKIL